MIHHSTSETVIDFSAINLTYSRVSNNRVANRFPLKFDSTRLFKTTRSHIRQISTRLLGTCTILNFNVHFKWKSNNAARLLGTLEYAYAERWCSIQLVLRKMLRIPWVFVNVCVLRMCQEVANSHLLLSPLSTFDGKSQEDTAHLLRQTCQNVNLFFRCYASNFLTPPF